jgi:transposase
MTNISNYVGIDMAKNDFFACLDEITGPRKFNNDGRGIKSFFSLLKKHNFQKDNTLLGVESTAIYHLRLCLESVEHGYGIKIINPLIVRKQNQTDLRRVKNDKKDSRLIRFCLVNGAGYLFNNDPEAIVLKSLIRQRDSLVSAKLRFARQQEDIRLKEKCLKQGVMCCRNFFSY